MNESLNTTQRQALADAFAAAHAEILKAEEITEQCRQGARLQFTRALHTRVELLTGSNRHPEIRQRDAVRLNDRHEAFYIAPAIVEACLQLSEDKNRNAQVLAKIRQQADELGYFLQKYNPPFELNRLESPQYIIAESYGQHPDSKNARGNEVLAASDCQCEIPLASNTAPFVIELPIEGDTVRDSGLVDHIKERPWSIGIVHDISTDAGMQRLKLAMEAQRASFAHIIHEINPTRGEFPVEKIAAAIAQVRGIQCPDGKQILLSSFGESAIMNQPSLATHLYQKNPPALAYELQHRRVPVEVDGVQYWIIVTWIVFVHSLNAHASQQ